MGIIEKLKEEQRVWDFKEENHEHDYFHRKSMPEILAYNKQYRKENPDKYGYNDAIKNYIIDKENIPTELHSILSTQVYLSQKDLQEEKKAIYTEKMLQEGWLPLTEDIVKKAIEDKKKIQLSASHTNDWMTIKVDKILKPKCFNGKYGLMELKARTRGYSLYQFENAFCKIVK